MKDRIILRCSADGLVNIPKAIYKELGWELGEPVEVDIAHIPCVDENDTVQIVQEICIHRVKDLDRLDEIEEDTEEWNRKKAILFKYMTETN